MPIFEYLCETCGLRQDAFFKIADRKDTIPCQACGNEAGFVMSAPKIFCDDITNTPWLRDFARTRKEARFGHKPIETRKEYKEYLQSHDLRDPHKSTNLTEI